MENRIMKESRCIDAFEDSFANTDDAWFTLAQRANMGLLAQNIPQTIALLRQGNEDFVVMSFEALDSLLFLTGSREIFDTFKEVAPKSGKYAESVPYALSCGERALRWGQKNVKKMGSGDPIEKLKEYISKEEPPDTEYYNPDDGKYYNEKVRLLTKDVQKSIAFIQTASSRELTHLSPIFTEALWITQSAELAKAFYYARDNLDSADLEEYDQAIEDGYFSFRFAEAPIPGALERMKQELANLYAVEDSDSAMSTADKEDLLLAEKACFCQDLPSAIDYLDEVPLKEGVRAFRFFDDAILLSGDRDLLEAFQHVYERYEGPEKETMKQKLDNGEALLAKSKKIRGNVNDQDWRLAALWWPSKHKKQDGEAHLSSIWLNSRMPGELAYSLARMKPSEALSYAEDLPTLLLMSHSPYLWDAFLTAADNASGEEEKKFDEVIDHCKKIFSYAQIPLFF